MTTTHRQIVSAARIRRPLSLSAITEDARAIERTFGYSRAVSVSHAIDREIHRATR